MPKLKVVRIEPASKCNLACSHCPTGTVEMTRDIMSDIIFEKVLENLSKYKDEVEVVVLYHGGEPLLNKSICQMITAIKSIKPFFINGTDSVECDHIEHTLTIRADGTIVPCCYDLTSKLPMGNILTDDIKELFTGSKYQYLRELIMNKNYPDLCANCNVVRPRKYLVPRWRSRSLEQADYL